MNQRATGHLQTPNGESGLQSTAGRLFGGGWPRRVVRIHSPRPFKTNPLVPGERVLSLGNRPAGPGAGAPMCAEREAFVAAHVRRGVARESTGHGASADPERRERVAEHGRAPVWRRLASPCGSNPLTPTIQKGPLGFFGCPGSSPFLGRHEFWTIGALTEQPELGFTVLPGRCRCPRCLLSPLWRRAAGPTSQARAERRRRRRGRAARGPLSVATPPT